MNIQVVQPTHLIPGLVLNVFDSLQAEFAPLSSRNSKISVNALQL